MTDDLQQSLQARLRPEDVADMIMTRIGHTLGAEEYRLLDQAARLSLQRSCGRMTALSNAFFQAEAPHQQVHTAESLFPAIGRLTAVEIADVDRLSEYVTKLSAEIGRRAGAGSFLNDRLDRAKRRAQGLEISRRRYNKLFRFLVRFERKIDTYRQELRRSDFRRIARSGLATRIPAADFAASDSAACFIAYYTARRNRRSEFTNQSQDGAFDQIARMLLDRFKRAPCEAGWRAIAYVMPDREVVAQLSDSSKMTLFAAGLGVMQDIAAMMSAVWEKSRFDRSTMIVARGDDSSTWNALAGAWNNARQTWLGTIDALGMADVLDLVCLGKAMRLMAADVAAWHRYSGGTLDPDTRVWAALPPPWLVFGGTATCTRAEVEAVCARFGVDPIARGWTAPRQNRSAVPFRPTPELVHGITVSHPDLALILRKAGWFSGRTTRPLPAGVVPVVRRDETGAALAVERGPGLAADLDAPPTVPPNSRSLE